MAKNEVKFWGWFLAVALVYTGVFLATRAASHEQVEWRLVSMDGHHELRLCAALQVTVQTANG